LTLFIIQSIYLGRDRVAQRKLQVGQSTNKMRWAWVHNPKLVLYLAL